MGRPLIGITTSMVESVQTLPCRYIDAVERAGGAPLMLPMTTSDEALQPVLQLIDGLVITGGPGITQGLVGTLPADLPAVETRRWRADCLAFASVQERQKPALGICYGMQFINVRLGGRLYADVQRQLGVRAHSPKRTDGQEIEHEVELEAGTLLAHIVGEVSAPVNSFHIQAVEQLGSGLQANACDKDGLIEGLEDAEGRLLGLQFHPEVLSGSVWDGVFEHLVQRAAE